MSRCMLNFADEIHNFLSLQVQGLMESRASPGTDFGLVINGVIEIADGQANAEIPLNILSDNAPELNETFQVMLSHIDVISPDIAPTYPPRLGEIQKAIVTILKNDNPNGIFQLRSDNPAASSDGRIVPVEEVDKLAVDLIVVRQG